MGVVAILDMWPKLPVFEQTFIPLSPGNMKFGFNRPSGYWRKEV